MSTLRLVIEFIFGLLAVANFATVVRADLNVYKLYSIEWLVDTSDVIAIVRFDHEQGFANPKIVRVFKGDVDRIQFPFRAAKKGTLCAPFQVCCQTSSPLGIENP